jgi:hypothetical protein
MSIATPFATRRSTFICGLVLLAFTGGLYLLNEAWAYNDTFSFAGIYTGYFLHWSEYLRTMPAGYPTSRLMWLVPGWLAYHCFTPYGANLAMRVYVIAGTATATWLTLRRLGTGQAGATIGVMLLLANPYFLQAAGWDYVNGAGIIWIAWSLYFLCAAATATRRHGWLFGAGAAMIASVLSYLMVGFFAPAYAWIYLRQRGWPETRPAIREMAWLGLGGVACTGALGLINMTMGGSFWFFLAQFRVAGGKLAATQQSYQLPEVWLPGAVWLILPCLSIVAAVLLALPSVRRRWNLSRSADAAGGAMLLAFSALGALDLCGVWVALEYRAGIHASYILPFAVLPLGLVIDRHLTRLRPGTQLAWVLITAGLLLAMYYTPIEIRVARGPMFWPGVIACTAIVLAFLAAAYRPTLFGLVIILLGLGWLNPRTAQGTTWQKFSQPFPRDQYLLMFDVVNRMASWDNGHPLMLWFDNHSEQRSDMFLGYYVASIRTGGEQTGIRLDTFPLFPSLSPQTIAAYPKFDMANLYPGARAVLLGDPVKLPDARVALAKLNLDLRVLDQEVVSHGQASIPMTVLEIVPRHA